MKAKNFKLVTMVFFSVMCFSANPMLKKHVLIIGDSISIGYTPYVETALAPDVTIDHNPGNGGSTLRGVENIEVWLDYREWDVIVFNFGLHDLVHKDKDSKYDVNGTVSVPLDQYRENLEKIVDNLRETTAILLFATTTVVPENSAGRNPLDPARYNEVAMEVMKKNGIAIIDLYTESLSIHPQNSKPGNVHYTPEGYELLAKHVTNAIQQVLENKH